jgi:hypothetical protein
MCGLTRVVGGQVPCPTGPRHLRASQPGRPRLNHGTANIPLSRATSSDGIVLKRGLSV